MHASRVPSPPNLCPLPLQLDASSVTVSLDETTTLADVDQLLSILNGGKGERRCAVHAAVAASELHVCRTSSCPACG